MLAHTLLKPAPVDGQAVAIDALGFLASDHKLMNRFLDLTGIEADGIRTAAAEPGFLAGVRDFLLAKETDLVAFSHATMTELSTVQAAREALDAGR